jgi:hypothetical protein
MVAKRLLRERVEFPGLRVALDLAIPCGRIKLGEPMPKLGEFISREGGDFLFESFELFHDRCRPSYHSFARRSIDFRIFARRSSGVFANDENCSAVVVIPARA